MTSLWEDEMNNIDVTVIQEDIDTARKGVCPITRALERAGFTADVLYGRLRLYADDTVAVYWVPSFVDDRMRLWDTQGIMEPFEFTAVRY